MQDIISSRNTEISSEGWLFGEKFNRIGNPFEWVDGNQLTNLGTSSSTINLIQYLSMSGEIYETPDSIRVPDHDLLLQKMAEFIREVILGYIPRNIYDKYSLERYVLSTASVKLQDYCALKSWCGSYFDTSRVHLDIGPGLGANAVYSTILMKNLYVSFEAHPVSYDVQRDFFRALRILSLSYKDPIDLYSSGQSHAEIAEFFRTYHSECKVTHCPSWYSQLWPANSVDLITATWVLNELNTAGCLWILYQAMRVLKKGGFFYIRDSGLLKPMRHQINYDDALVRIGFKKIMELNVVNRVDMHGIPRIFQKFDSNLDTSSFEDFYNLLLSREAVVSHGGAYSQV